MLSADKIFTQLFQGLNPRQREVLTHRFGLHDGKKPVTLAALGKRHGVTRERIRQIEASVLDSITKKINANPSCNDIIQRSHKHLQKHGGAVRQDNLLQHHRSFVDGLTANHIELILEATGAFYSHPENEHVLPFYYLDKESLKGMNDLIGQFVKFIRQAKEDVIAGAYETHLARFMRQQKHNAKFVKSYLEISKKIHTNAYGDTGLAEWQEIKPKTIRDRIYLVLKKNDKPLHFEDIARLINEAGLSARKALAPTVHNELIKDERFVLVGRGIYGLLERGYQVGTAREVIQKILKKNGPLNFQELIEHIQQDRIFKPNTILANLQNRGLFERLDDGRYRIRQS